MFTHIVIGYKNTYNIYVYVFICVLCLSITKCCRFGSGQNCAFPCNCNNNSCDQETGDCTDYGGCRSTLPSGYGWGGPGCLVGNVAYNKEISQSSDYDGLLTATNGNDGDISCGSDQYTHTRADNPAWLRIDLGSRYNIHNVTVYDRQDVLLGFYRLPGSKIQILDSNSVQDCATITDENYSEIMTFTCNSVGDAVRLYRDGANSIIHICELVVMGHPYIARISACDIWENDVIGCRICQAGRKLPNCMEECSSGTHGINCQYQCSNNCKSGFSPICDVVSGRCRYGCKGWYVGDTCHTEMYRLLLHNDDISARSGSTTITITWRAASPPPPSTRSYYHYIIRYRIVGGIYVETRNIPLIDDMASEQAYTITNLTHNTEYEYIVRSVRTVGDMSDIYDASVMRINTQFTGLKSPGTEPVPLKTTTPQDTSTATHYPSCEDVCRANGCSAAMMNAAISMMVVSVLIAVASVLGAVVYVKRTRPIQADQTPHLAPVPLQIVSNDNQMTHHDGNNQTKGSLPESQRGQNQTEYYNLSPRNDTNDYEDVRHVNNYQTLEVEQEPVSQVKTVYQTLK